ncbi:MAG: nicotinate-nucleotide adenylyltransferase [Verrucomicrobia bacterium]|nr:MAG: nicotinate-nucleotide adenylyltransferase [Verrucomicrobiota bacterium]
MRIALFGGSFDPVHHGHLLLAQDALEQLELDRLVFIPAGINPHKLHATPKADGLQRLRMLEAAVAGEERLAVDALEIYREGPSYTVDTVESLQERWPAARLFLLLGEDNLPKLHTWHRIERLNQLVEFVCFGRSTEEKFVPAFPGKLRLSRRVDISSTEIRQRIAAGLSIRYLVPESVRAFIYAHAIYQPHKF